MRIEEINIQTDNGQETLASCSDEDFVAFISSIFEVKQATGGWTRESRQLVFDQAEYLIDRMVDSEVLSSEEDES